MRFTTRVSATLLFFAALAVAKSWPNAISELGLGIAVALSLPVLELCQTSVAYTASWRAHRQSFLIRSI